MSAKGGREAVLARLLSTTILLLACLAATRSVGFAQAGGEHWVGTWATAPVALVSGAPSPMPVTPANLKNQTLRQIVHVSAGGASVRVVFSNVFGTAPLEIGAAHIGRRDKGAAIVRGSDRVLTFGGNLAATIPAGAVMFSDAAKLDVAELSDLVVDLFLPGDTAASTSPLTVHSSSRQTNYVSPEGNYAGAVEIPVQTMTSSWYFLSRVEVAAPAGARSLVMFGDSITDGFNSTPETNNRWPDVLARRLRLRSGRLDAGVLNLGIDGNQVLSDGYGISALARLDRDVLAQTGVTYVVVAEGINDLGIRQRHRASAADLITGHLQLIERAHARGLKIYGATLLPYEGTTYPGYWSAEGESTREKFNEWMRSSHAYDSVIDFDAVVRDPDHPTRLLPKYDSGDHLHPNDAGYQAMANAVDLALFQARRAKQQALTPLQGAPKN